MELALLADHTEAIDTLAAWYAREWEPYYGRQGPGDARADLISRCNRDQLPIGMVVFDRSRICGTAALDRDAITGLTPSVVGLLVAKNRRRKGVARMLIDGAGRITQNLNYDELFMSTAILGEMLLREGWSEQGEVDFLNGERGRVYVRSLARTRNA